MTELTDNQSQIIFNDINTSKIVNDFKNQYIKNQDINDLKNQDINDFTKENKNDDINIDNLELKKKYIIDTIKNFSKVEHIEIFKIFKKHNVKYTENSNGIFVNLNVLNEKIINRIETFVNFCIANKDYLSSEKSKIEKMKTLISEKNKIQEENLNFDHNNIDEKNNKESTYQYQYEHDNIDNNEMYYQESKFIIPLIK